VHRRRVARSPGVYGGIMKKRNNQKTHNQQTKQETGVQWIKAASGNTYLCPTSVLDKIDVKNESDLKRACVDESTNPHNT